MAKKPEPLKLTTWKMYKIASKGVWLGEVDAPDEAAAIEKAAAVFKAPANRLIAIRAPRPPEPPDAAGGWGQFERRTAFIFAISLLVVGGTLACIAGIWPWLLVGMEISIVCHELGHALVAVLGSMEVHSIVFGGGPLLWHRRFGETRVEWRVWPLTGYVTVYATLTPRWYWLVLFVLGGIFGNMAVIGLLAALDAVKTVSDAAGSGIVMPQVMMIFVNLIPFSLTLNGKRVESDGSQLLKILWPRRAFTWPASARSAMRS